MEKKNKKSVGFREHVLNFRSPIRWGFLGIGVAISLFLAEISLSLLQVFLSLLGGDIVIATWVQILVAVMAILTFLLCLAVVGLTIYAGVLWRRNKSINDTQQVIQMMQEDIQKIKGKLDK